MLKMSQKISSTPIRYILQALHDGYSTNISEGWNKMTYLVRDVSFKNDTLRLEYDQFIVWVHNPEASKSGFEDNLWVATNQLITFNDITILNNPINEWREERGLSPVTEQLRWYIVVDRNGDKEPWETDPDEWKLQ